MDIVLSKNGVKCVVLLKAKSKGKIIAPSREERKRATTIVVAIFGRAITIWEAIQIRSHEPIYKTHAKIEAKRLRATTFAFAKLEER